MSSVSKPHDIDGVDLELPPFPVRRWSVDEYMLFAKLGILDEDDGVELLEGWIVPKMPKNPRHDSTIDQVNVTLTRLIPPGWYFRVQNSFLGASSVPEPDLLLVSGTPRDYAQKHPSGSNAALVIEVADSSWERDRMKRSIYAGEGIPTYWIINLIENHVEVYTGPSGTGRHAMYGLESRHGEAEQLKFVFPDGKSFHVPVADLLT